MSPARWTSRAPRSLSEKALLWFLRLRSPLLALLLTELEEGRDERLVPQEEAL